MIFRHLKNIDFEIFPHGIGFPKLFGGCNILCLCSLVSPAEQDHKDVAILSQIHSVPWPKVEFQFVDALTYGLEIAKVTEAYAVEANTDPRTNLRVSESDKPIPKRIFSCLC